MGRPYSVEVRVGGVIERPDTMRVVAGDVK